MSLFGIADRVQETSTSTGTGTITLAGAVAGYQTFANALSDGSPCCYVIQSGSNWETGVGVIHGSSLSRETILGSSNSNARVNLASGTKTVFISRVSGLQDAVLVTAGTTVAQADAVVFQVAGVDDGGSQVALKSDASDASLSVDAILLGLCCHAAFPGKPVLVRYAGIMPGLSLQPGTEYFLATNAGGITASPPANRRSVGVATSEGELLINLERTNKIASRSGAGGIIGMFGPGLTGNPLGGTSGSVQRTSVMDYLDLTTLTGNASSRGTLAVAVSSYCVGASSSQLYVSGGASGLASPVVESTIQVANRHTLTGNSVDTGDLLVARAGLAAVSGSLRTFMAGGLSGSGQSNAIDYLTFSTFTTATADCGDLLVARSYLAGVNSTVGGVFAGGFNTVFSSQIDAISTSSTTQNASNRGDLMERKRSLAACGSGATNVTSNFVGGYNGDFLATIEALDIHTYSTISIDRGELLLARASAAASNSGNVSAIGGGTSGGELGSIEMLTNLDSSLNVSDRGDLSYARHSLGGD